MTPEAKKQFNVIAGSSFGVLGLVSFLVAMYVASVPAAPKPAPVAMHPVVNLSSCQEALNKMGYTTSLVQGGVSAVDAALDNPEAALTKATAAIGLCKLKMTAFCLGAGCEQPGLSFTLSSNPKAEAAAKPAVKETPKTAEVKP